MQEVVQPMELIVGDLIKHLFIVHESSPSYTLNTNMVNHSVIVLTMHPQESLTSLLIWGAYHLQKPCGWKFQA